MYANDSVSSNSEIYFSLSAAQCNCGLCLFRYPSSSAFMPLDPNRHFAWRFCWVRVAGRFSNKSAILKIDCNFTIAWSSKSWTHRPRGFSTAFIGKGFTSFGSRTAKGVMSPDARLFVMPTIIMISVKMVKTIFFIVLSSLFYVILVVLSCFSHFILFDSFAQYRTPLPKRRPIFITILRLYRMPN